MLRILFLSIVNIPLFLFAQLARPCPVAEEVDSLIQISRAFTNNWEIDTAFVLSEQAATLALTQCGKQSVSYGAACFNEGRVRHLSGNYEEAIPWYQQSLDIRATTLGKHHLDYGKSLNNLAITYDLLGRYEEAEWLYLQALALRKRALGRNSRPYSSVLGNLASMYTSMGRYEESEQLLLQALSIREEVAGDTSLTYAHSLQNLGYLYYQLGLNELAQTHLLQAHHIYVEQQDTQSRKYQLLLSLLGNVYYEASQYSESLHYFEQGERLAASLYGTEHSYYASSLNELALVKVELSQFEEAEAYWQHALAILEEGSLFYGFYAQNLMRLYFKQGNYQQAANWQRTSAKILSDRLSPTHSRWLQNLLFAGRIEWQEGNLSKAAEAFIALFENERRSIELASRHLSEREMLAYLEDVNFSRDYMLSLARHYPDLVDLCYDGMLFYKGFILQSSQRARQIALNNEYLRADYQNFLALHRQLAKQYALDKDDQYATAALEEQIRVLEKQLRRSSADLAAAWEQTNWSDVQAALAADAVAIEFVHYQSYSPDASTDTTLYAALLVAPSLSHPQLISLCSQKDLETIIQKENGIAEEVDLLYRPTAKGASLYQHIWKPIQATLENLPVAPTSVYYANSGLLHRLQLAALPLSQGGVLGEKIQLHQLGSTRELVTLAIDTSTTSDEKTALLYGGIDYQLDTNAIAMQFDKLDDMATPLARRDFRGAADFDHWAPLPWTEVEVSLAQDFLKAEGFSTQLKTGEVATEAFLKQSLRHHTDVKSPQILHLATHAYFAGNAKDQSSNNFLRASEPLMRSGLVLAGGNYIWQHGHPWSSSAEDGILTAYELSQLNLDHTDLIILSACETGLGHITGMEGVYGLQRACKIAGARYVIMSLWQIPDFQTQAFMTTFYDHYLTGKKSIPAAFNAAQADMRQQFGAVSAWAGLILLE